MARKSRKLTDDQKIQYLRTGVTVRDKLIGALLHEFAVKKIPVPPYLMDRITLLYSDKLKKDAANERRKSEENEIKDQPKEKIKDKKESILSLIS